MMRSKRTILLGFVAGTLAALLTGVTLQLIGLEHLTVGLGTLVAAIVGFAIGLLATKKPPQG